MIVLSKSKLTLEVTDRQSWKDKVCLLEEIVVDFWPTDLSSEKPPSYDVNPSPTSDVEVTNSSQSPVINESKLVTKIDWHIVPCLCVMYLLSFLDR